MTNRFALTTSNGTPIAAGPLALIAAQAAHLRDTEPVDVSDGHHVARVTADSVLWLAPQELCPEPELQAPPRWMSRITVLLAELGDQQGKTTTP